MSADRRKILLVRWLAIPAGLVLTAIEVQASPNAERTVALPGWRGRTLL